MLKKYPEPIVNKNFKEKIFINGNTYEIYTDNRAKSSRIDIHYYKIGDFHKPWYFYGDRKNKHLPNYDTNNFSLIYDIRNHIFDLEKNKIKFTSFSKTPDSKGMDKLIDVFREEDQQEYIICEKHFSKNANNLKFKKNFFKKNSELDDLRVFEGHHRLVAFEKLKRKIYARVYYSYNIDGPNIDIPKHYNSAYSPELWNVYKDIFNKDVAQPWFKLEQFKHLNTTPKFQILMKCIQFILSLNIKLNYGLDIGCAEGAYTYLFSKELGVAKMKGIDSEPARIIRAYLAKYYYNLENLDFKANEVETFDFEGYDFISCLSVTHHLEDPMNIMEKICKNKKIIILENRIKDNTETQSTQIKQVCSLKDFIDHNFTEKLSKKIGMNYKHIGNDGDRHFYVLYQSNIN